MEHAVQFSIHRWTGIVYEPGSNRITRFWQLSSGQNLLQREIQAVRYQLWNLLRAGVEVSIGRIP